MKAARLRSPLRDLYVGHLSPRSKNLAYLSRSASTQSSSSKYGCRGVDQSGGDESKPSKRNPMLIRGTSFRRQGSSGMTWADNWTFTDEGMVLGRNSKVANAVTTEKSTRSSKVDKDPALKASGEVPEDALQRSRSVGTSAPSKHRTHRLWGLRWLKKSLKKAFK